MTEDITAGTPSADDKVFILLDLTRDITHCTESLVLSGSSSGGEVLKLESRKQIFEPSSVSLISMPTFITGSYLLCILKTKESKQELTFHLSTKEHFAFQIHVGVNKEYTC